MQLYLHCQNCSRKITLGSDARTRSQLAYQWGPNFYIVCPHCQYQGFYSVHEVFAETNSKATPVGAIIGGLIGLFLGPEGALIGSAIGGAGGFAKAEEDKRMVREFNDSY